MARAAVIGGGLAGITAALDLADGGVEVDLLESRARLGGLTTSFRRDDLWVDNGQHVFLRCCTAYRALLHRLGVTDLVTLQDRLHIDLRSEHSDRRGALTRNDLPAPLQLGGALLRHPWMSTRERLHTARVALALRAVDPASPQAQDRSFGDWLRDRGVRPNTAAMVWDLIGLATLNAHADDASLALAATVFRRSLLRSRDGADIGWSRVPLHRLHGEASLAALHERGVRVITRARVREIERVTPGWSVRHDGGDVQVDRVVLAVPPTAADQLLPAADLGLREGYAERLGSSPIVNLHLVIDRPVLDTPLIAAVTGPLQWIFDRTASSGLTDGQYLVCSLSAADALIRRPTAELRQWAMPHLLALLPGLATARVEDFFVTREPHATFRPSPGCRADRARAHTPQEGLAVAGAWTDTGWPATMEGAVRSGHAAAAILTEVTPAPRDEVAA